MPHDITALIAWVKDKHTRSGVQQWNGTNGLDALDAIAAALEATQWQPIETAPKDGSLVLVGSRARGGLMVAATWSMTYARWRILGAPVDVWFLPDVWMPLPPNPEAQS